MTDDTDDKAADDPQLDDGLVQHDFGDGVPAPVVAEILPVLRTIQTMYPNVEFTPDLLKTLYVTVRQDFARNKASDAVLRARKFLDDAYNSQSDARDIETDRFEFALGLVASLDFDMGLVKQYLDDKHRELVLYSPPPTFDEDEKQRSLAQKLKNL